QNSSRRGIDRVVDEYEIAFGYGRPAAARSDLHLEFRCSPVLAHVVEMTLRHADRHQHRPRAVDHHERNAAAATCYQVPGADAQATGTPRDRRRDFSVSQL